MTVEAASGAAGEPAPRKISVLRSVLFGTGTNYVRVFVRLLGGMFTFRLLFKALGAQDFGFYQMMWSTIGYAVLLDFGFGTSVQRAVAATVDFDHEAARQERREAISTVFWSYVAVDLALALVIFFCGDRLLHLLHFQGQDSLARYRPVALIFLSGIFLGFPFGVFREALRGLNKIHVGNVVDISFSTLQSVLIITGCLLHWSLPLLTTAAVALTVLPIWTMALVAMQDPDLRPRLSHFRWRQMRTLSSFSVYAYVITMTGLILSQSDQLVIGALVSVEAVALYVPGAKLAQVYWSMASQMQDTLGPVAARLGGIKDALARGRALKTLLVASQRWSVMIATLFGLPLLVDMRGAIDLITGEHAPPRSAMLVGYLLVGNLLLSITGLSCVRRILMMIDHHRVLLAFSIAEASVNFGLSIYLTRLWQDSTGAAAGTFVATIVVSLIAIPIYGCRVLGVSGKEFLVHGSARGLAANTGAFAVAALWWGALPAWNSTFHFLAGCGLCAAAAVPGWWRIGMREDERERVLSAWKRLRRLPAVPPLEPGIAL